MLRAVVALLAVALAWGADGEWARVRAVPGGTEIRIYRNGSSKATLARMDEASEESLIVVVKNEQVAIPRAEIDRVDARPAAGGKRVSKQTKTAVDAPDGKVAAPPSSLKGSGGPSSSTSTTVLVGGKAEFETIYRRRSGVSARP